MRTAPGGPQSERATRLTQPAAAAAPGGTISGIDGLRALGVVGVVTWHAVIVLALPGWWTRELILQSRTAVEMFFILSGFLMYRSFVAANLTGRRPPRLGSFARIRFLRVFPAFWLALVVSTVVLGKTEIETTRDWLAHLTLQQPWSEHQMLRGLGVTWTLAAEVLFYSLLPLYAWGMRSLGSRIGTLRAEYLGAGALVVAGLAFQVWADSTGRMFAGGLWFPFYWPMFGLGIGLAVAERSLALAGRIVAPVEWVKRHPALCWTAGGAILVAMSLSRPFQFKAHFAFDYWAQYHDVSAVAAFLIVLPLVFRSVDESRIHRFLRRPEIAYLGVVSYGMYLWHMPIIDVIREDWLGLEQMQGNWLLIGGLTLLVTLAVSATSWHLMEKPLLELAKRKRALEQRPSAPAPGAG